MKKLLMILCAAIFTLALAAAIHAVQAKAEGTAIVDTDSIPYGNSPVNKLGRGAINTVTCWAEVPGEIARVSKETDPLLGFTLGFVQGSITGIVRGATGLYDVFTFFLPPYDKPVMTPEYGIQDADKKIRDYLW